MFCPDGVQQSYVSLSSSVQLDHSEFIDPTLKHTGGSVIIKGCVIAKGVGEMTVIDGTIYSMITFHSTLVKII